jgi:hypothetical protein
VSQLLCRLVENNFKTPSAATAEAGIIETADGASSVSPGQAPEFVP